MLERDARPHGHSHQTTVVANEEHLLAVGAPARVGGAAGGDAILRRRDLAEATNEFGVQLEQYIFQELKAYISLREKEHSLEFWRVDNKYEVDFVIYEKLEEIFAIGFAKILLPLR